MTTRRKRISIVSMKIDIPALIFRVLSIIGAIIYFVTFYILERYYKHKDQLLYYIGYYALRVGAVIVIVSLILFAILSLGVFSSLPTNSI